MKQLAKEFTALIAVAMLLIFTVSAEIQGKSLDLKKQAVVKTMIDNSNVVEDIVNTETAVSVSSFEFTGKVGITTNNKFTFNLTPKEEKSFGFYSPPLRC